MLKITSREHPTVKLLVKLQKSARFRKQSKLAILDGIHLIQTYLNSDRTPEMLVISESGQNNEEIRSILKTSKSAQKSSVILVTDHVFQKISPVQSPTGILASIPIPDTVCPNGPVHHDCCVSLETLQDPGNLGTILRTAAAAGFEHIYLSADCTDVWSPKTLRAAMGAHFVLNIHTDCDLLEIASQFQGQVLGTSPTAEKNLYQIDFMQPTAFVFGNEGAGLTLILQQAVDETISIPMPGKIESLNAAIAASICLYEKVRQTMQLSNI